MYILRFQFLMNSDMKGDIQQSSYSSFAQKEKKRDPN